MTTLTRLRRQLAAAAIIAVPLTVALGPAAHAQPPSNDDIANATVVESIPFEDDVDTTEATTAPDDPDCAGNGHTVWYSFTPAERVEVVFSTDGSDYDTTLSAYTGDPGSLQQIRCNDDFNDLQSRIRFTAQAGTRYFIMAGSFDDSPGGSLVLTATRVPPKVVLGISADPTGTVDRQGLATVSGSVTCSRPVTVDVRGSLRQQLKRNRVALGYFNTSVDCDQAAAWSVGVQGQTGVFGRGDARLSASVLYADPLRGDTSSATTTVTVRLTRSG